MSGRDRKDLWSLEYLIKDMLFETNMSFPDMAERLGIPEHELHKKIKEYGLGWVRKSRKKKMSRGHATLKDIIQKLIPGEEVITEYHLGERLFLDVYCPAYEIGAEYHGRQHFHYSNFFFDDLKDFKAAQARDARKVELCKEQGIALIVFRFDEDLNENVVFDRMIQALKETPRAKKDSETKRGFKGDHYYESAKLRNRQWRKSQYRQWKQRQKRERDGEDLI